MLEFFLGYKKIMGDAEAEAEVENIMNTVDTNNSGTIDYSGILFRFKSKFLS
jgi:hypothetical protein